MQNEGSGTRGMTVLHKRFANNIKTILRERDRSVKWLADNSNMDPSSISRMLSGITTPSFQAIEQIAEAFKIEASLLFIEHAGSPSKMLTLENRTDDLSEIAKQRVFLDLISKKLDLVISFETKRDVELSSRP